MIINNAELDLIHDLHEIERKLTKFYGATSIAYEFSSEKTEIYSDELDEFPFGMFWFQIRSIRIRSISNNVSLKLKVIRQVDDSVYNKTRADVSGSSKCKTDNNESLEWTEIASVWKEASVNGVKEFLYYKVNRENIASVLQFLGLLVVGLSVASVSFVKAVGVFTLRFLFEFSRLVKVCTPIFLGTLDFLSKIFGGFYILLAMLWKDSIGGGGERRPPPPLPAVQYHKTYDSVYKRKPIGYTHNQYS